MRSQDNLLQGHQCADVISGAASSLTVDGFQCESRSRVCSVSPSQPRHYYRMKTFRTIEEKHQEGNSVLSFASGFTGASHFVP